ncbi:MAG: YcxB family protein [Asticcacaulis sp.]
MTQTIELAPYRVTFEEYRDFNLHFLMRHYRHWKSWLIFLPAPAFIAVMFFFKAADLPGASGVGISLTAFVISFVVAVILMQGWAFTACMMRFKKQPVAQGDLRVSLTTERFISALPHQEGRYEWAGIKDVVRYRDLTLVYVHPHVAIIVPDRVFPDAAASATFFETVRDRWQAAKTA